MRGPTANVDERNLLAELNAAAIDDYGEDGDGLDAGDRLLGMLARCPVDLAEREPYPSTRRRPRRDSDGARGARSRD